MGTVYSNPRTEAVIPDWPLGRDKRGDARFVVECNRTRGERIVRTTTGKPKCGVYARKVRIVDGDDGRTYIASLAPYSGAVSVMRGTMDFQHEVIPHGDPRYAETVTAIFG